jgi:DNA-binding MarR family transcriptional regulator
MKELIKWVSITDRFSKMYLNKRFEKFGINSSHHMFIIEICENEGVTQDKLFPLVYVNKSNITRALAQLEKAGFITKEPNKKDKRTVKLYPTEKARKIYEDIIQIKGEWTDILINNLSSEDEELLEKLIRKIGQNAIDYLSEDEEGME